MDRTNWKYGSVPINILMLGCVYQGTVIPLCWTVLNKAGNSSMVEHIRLMNTLFSVLPKTRIAVFIADREFIAADWLSYLRLLGIQRCIRIRQNSLTVYAGELKPFLDIPKPEALTLKQPTSPSLKNLISCLG